MKAENKDNNEVKANNKVDTSNKDNLEQNQNEDIIENNQIDTKEVGTNQVDSTDVDGNTSATDTTDITNDFEPNDNDEKKVDEKPKKNNNKRANDSKRGKTKKLELMREPNSGKVRQVEKQKESFEMNETFDREDLLLPTQKLSIAQFRGEIVTLPSEKVVPKFKEYFKNGLFENPRAVAIELQRLGYAIELEEHNITISKK